MAKIVTSAFVVFCLLNFYSLRVEGQSRDTLSPKAEIILAKIDSMALLPVFDDHASIEKSGSLSSGKKIAIPKFPNLIYEYRIEDLAKRTPMELVYNIQVKKFIDLYTINRHRDFSKILGLSNLYFPIFEDALSRYGLPLELKYLPVVESALNPLAVSKSGAVGLWQLLLNTSKLFNMKIDSYIDERYDPLKSTEVACQYLKYLYRIFNDWDLVLAAYNGGPAAVRNAIVRSGGKTNFWDIKDYLPAETQAYIPAFIAANYVMNYAEAHHIYTEKPLLTYSQIDTVKIDRALSFQQISKKIDISPDLLHFLNPVYKLGFIPDLKKPQILVLPSDKITTFLKLQNSIYSTYIPPKNYNTLVANAGNTENMEKVNYIVKKGDSFHKISLAFNCTPENIMAWNKLTSRDIHIGQKMDIWVARGDSARLFSNKDKDNLKDTISLPVSQRNRIIYYKVKKGDTIWSISEKFKLQSPDSIKSLNNLKKGIHIGQKLKIPIL